MQAVAGGEAGNHQFAGGRTLRTEERRNCIVRVAHRHVWRGQQAIHRFRVLM